MDIQTIFWSFLDLDGHKSRRLPLIRSDKGSLILTASSSIVTIFLEVNIMAKPDKTTKAPSPFENFKKFAEALVAVPKKELDEKLLKYKRLKDKKKPA